MLLEQINLEENNNYLVDIDEYLKKYSFPVYYEYLILQNGNYWTNFCIVFDNKQELEEFKNKMPHLYVI